MTRPSPAIVVTLSADSVEAARRQIDSAARGGADLAEVRFDRWDEKALGRAGELFPSALPLMATLRSRAEGGSGPDEPARRSEVLRTLAQLPFRWIDLESSRDLELLDQIPSPSSLGRILSTHYPAGVRPEEWKELLRAPAPEGCVRKVVARAGIGAFLQELAPGIPPPGEEAVVALTTGPSGPLSRAWARRLGLPMVFAAPPMDSEDPPITARVEPSQVPVDHLRPFLTAENSPPMFGIAGHPVTHSRSPELHARWMAQSHRVGLYLPLDFESEAEFVDALGPLADAGFRGLNVTHPWKSAALEAATEVTGGAALCGVANTLTFRGDAIEAENTDLAAILRRLEELRASQRWDGGSLSVVGAGGAARATLAAARTLGARANVYARRPDSAEGIAQKFGALAPGAENARPDSLVVHATAAGRAEAGALEIPLDALIEAGGLVLDWVYAPDRPEVRTIAEDAGASYEDGRRLLVYQAAASFGVWWGEEPSSGMIDSALREEGCTE